MLALSERCVTALSSFGLHDSGSAFRTFTRVNTSDGCCKGVARGVLGARDPPFVSLFLSKQPTIFRGENAMTIVFDTV